MAQDGLEKPNVKLNQEEETNVDAEESESFLVERSNKTSREILEKREIEKRLDDADGSCTDAFMETTTPGTGKQTNKRIDRHRLLHTMCVCSTMLGLGWSFGMMGPTFPDLRLIMNKDLATASWIFTGWAIGSLVGALVGGVAYDHLNKLRLFIVISLGLGLSVAAAPWCQPFPAMFTVHVVIGFFGGVIKAASNADMHTLWKEDTRIYLQVLNSLMCLGAIISPIVSDPFMAHLLSTGVTVTVPNATSYNDTMVTIPKSNEKWPGNMVNGSTVAMETHNTTNEHVDVDRDRNEPVYGETRIHISYFISGLVCLVSAAMYVFVTVKYGNVYTKIKTMEEQNKSEELEDDKSVDKRTQYLLSDRWKQIFTILMALAITLYTNSERIFSQFQMTFIISTLGWTKSEGSKCSSMFWITFTIVRILSIFFVKKLKLSTILAVFLTLMACSSALLWVSVVYDMKPLVWVSIAATGFSMAPIFGTLFSVVSEKIRSLTGKVTGFFFVASSAVGMGFPILLGFLMDTASKMWFVYFSMILYGSLICCITFVQFLYFRLQKKM